MFVILNIPAFGEMLRICVFGICFRLDTCSVNNIIGFFTRSSVVYTFIVTPPRPQTLHRSHDKLKNPYRIACMFSYFIGRLI